MKDTAVSCYLDNKPHLLRQFRWLCDSWKMTGCDKMSDLCVFYHPGIPADTFTKDVIAVPLYPLSETKPQWAQYPFVNSIQYLLTQEALFLGQYKFVLKTDHDVFLTEHFRTLRPRLALFGCGLYSHDFSVMHKLLEIHDAAKIEMCFSNVGASLMAHSRLVRIYAEYHLAFTEMILRDHFKTKAGKWPGWWQGTASMYGGLLAANALFGTNMTMGGLDCHSESGDTIGSTDYHIHAQHCHNMFSKHRWEKGEYDFLLDSKNYNTETVNGYCLAVAGRRKDAA